MTVESGILIQKRKRIFIPFFLSRTLNISLKERQVEEERMWIILLSDFMTGNRTGKTCMPASRYGEIP